MSEMLYLVLEECGEALFWLGIPISSGDLCLSRLIEVCACDLRPILKVGRRWRE